MVPSISVQPNGPTMLVTFGDKPWTMKREQSSPARDAFKSEPGMFWKTERSALPNVLLTCRREEAAITKVGFGITRIQNAPTSFYVYAFTRVKGSWIKPRTVLLQVRHIEWTKNHEFKTWILPREKRAGFNCYGLKLQASMPGVKWLILRNILMWEEA